MGWYKNLKSAIWQQPSYLCKWHFIITHSKVAKSLYCCFCLFCIFNNTHRVKTWWKTKKHVLLLHLLVEVSIVMCKLINSCKLYMCTCSRVHMCAYMRQEYTEPERKTSIRLRAGVRKWPCVFVCLRERHMETCKWITTYMCVFECARVCVHETEMHLWEVDFTIYWEKMINVFKGLTV